MPNNRKQLRQAIRTRRQILSVAEQQSASFDLAKTIISSSVFQSSQKIAAYIATQGEIDPMPLLKIATQQGKQCYLPILDWQHEHQLCFMAYTPSDLLIPNRYKIPEPKPELDKIITPNNLDLVLTPLLGFDLVGNRLGMGGGYYDRTFAFLQQVQRPPKPYLLGLAYDWQQCNTLASESWDVMLNGVATDKHYYGF